MSVGIKVDFLWYSIGTDEFLYSFFSTVAIRLEKGIWGTRFPIVMKELYSGELNYTNCTLAYTEIMTIKKELSELSPEFIVWDADDLTKKPPWDNEISKDITSLGNYFITSDGRELIDVLLEAINEAKIEKVNLVIKKL